MSRIKLRAFWPSGLALAATLLIVAFGYPRSHVQRVSNLALADGIPETYVIPSRSDPGRCYVVNRRASTLRRSDAAPRARLADFVRLPNEARPGAPDTWIVESKDEGVIYFVPVEQVHDWTYPFFYGLIRREASELRLPSMEWTQLFASRLYEGLYLRISLPFDVRGSGGGEVPLQILAMRDGRLTVLESSEAHERYVELVGEDALAAARPTAPIPDWLARRCPTGDGMLWVSYLVSGELSLLPLPVSLPGDYLGRRGRRSAAGRLDAAWRSTVREADASDVLPFMNGDHRALGAAFESYATSFREALAAHAELHQTLPAVRALLARRQAAAADVQLSLGEL